MPVWWTRTLDQTQGGRSRSFLLVLRLVVSLTYYSICKIHDVSHTRGSLLVTQETVPWNFVPSPPLPRNGTRAERCKVMFNPGAPSQVLAPTHSLSTNCAHGNYAATRLVGNLPSPSWRQPCGPPLLLLKSKRFLALTLCFYPAPNPPCSIGAVCPGALDEALGLLRW